MPITRQKEQTHRGNEYESFNDTETVPRPKGNPATGIGPLFEGIFHRRSRHTGCKHR